MGFFAVPVGLELAEGAGVDPVVVDADVSQVVVAVDLPGLVFHTGPWAVGDDVADVADLTTLAMVRLPFQSPALPRMMTGCASSR